MNYNKVILLGYMTRKPSVNYPNNNLKVCDFSIAVNENYNDNEKVYFFECVSFSKVADIIENFGDKGKRVFIEGSLKQETWESKDGDKKNRIRVVVQKIIFLSKIEKDNNNYKEINKVEENYNRESVNDDKKYNKESNYDNDWGMDNGVPF